MGSQRKFGHAIWPVVAETWDGDLNDIEGFHITSQDAVEAIEAAKPGAVQEGNVGGGAGMVCFGFKGGIGTASRRSPFSLAYWSSAIPESAKC